MMTKIITKDGKEIDLLKLRSNILKIMYCLDNLNLKSEDLENCVFLINWLLQKPDCKCEKDFDVKFNSDVEKKMNEAKEIKEIVEGEKNSECNYISDYIERFYDALEKAILSIFNA